MVHLKRILVPVDFNVPSRAALAFAHEIAGALGASVDVLHVIDLPSEHSLAAEGYVPLPTEYRQTVHDRAQARLTEWMETSPASGHATHHVADGSPAAEIVRYAGEHQSDLIVLGTHGRTGVAHAFLGSVAEKVVRTAHCPVLTVRGAKET